MTPATPEQIAAAIEAVIRREGGYVDHPDDRGGPTNHGVTQATLAAHRGRPVTASDVEAMTVDEARAIYRKLYVDQPGLGVIGDPFLFDLVVDTAVHMGPARAIRFLQRALGVEVDGKLGLQTRVALQEADVARIARKFTADRVRYYGTRITSDRSQAVFAAGWCARAAEFIERIP